MNTIKTITMALALTASSLVFAAGADSTSIGSYIGRTQISKPTATSGKSVGSLVRIPTMKEIQTIIKEIETIREIEVVKSGGGESTPQIKYTSWDNCTYGTDEGNGSGSSCYPATGTWIATNVNTPSASYCSSTFSYCFENSDVETYSYVYFPNGSAQLRTPAGTALERCRAYKNYTGDVCPF